MGIRLLLVFVGVLSAAGCATPTQSEFLPTPELDIVVGHWTGSTFRSRSATATVPSPEDFNSVLVTFHAVESLSDTLLEAVTEHANLFLQSGERGFFLPAPRHLAGTRVGFGPDARRAIDVSARDGVFGRTVEIGNATGIVAAGTTATIDLQKRRPEVRSHLRQPIHEALFIDLTQSADGDRYILAIGVRQVAEPEPALSTAGMTEEVTTEKDETTIAELEGLLIEAFVMELDVSEVPHVVYALLPAPFLEEEVAGILVSATIEKPPTVYTMARREHNRSVREFDLEAERREGEKERSSLESPLGRQVWSGLKSAVNGLSRPDHRRSALAWVARETGARLAEDVALTSSDAAVLAVAERILEASKSLPQPCEKGHLGLVIEQCTYAILLELLEARDPPPAVVGLIVRHTGEVGRHITVLEEFVATASSLEDLRTLIRDQNRILLEDGSPISRVRAYDWLVLSGAAPPDFDPLDPREVRREALNRFFESLKAEEGER